MPPRQSGRWKMRAWLLQMAPRCQDCPQRPGYPMWENRAAWSSSRPVAGSAKPPIAATVSDLWEWHPGQVACRFSSLPRICPLAADVVECIGISPLAHLERTASRWVNCIEAGVEGRFVTQGMRDEDNSERKENTWLPVGAMYLLGTKRLGWPILLLTRTQFAIQALQLCLRHICLTLPIASILHRLLVVGEQHFLGGLPRNNCRSGLIAFPHTISFLPQRHRVTDPAAGKRPKNNHQRLCLGEDVQQRGNHEQQHHHKHG